MRRSFAQPAPAMAEPVHGLVPRPARWPKRAFAVAAATVALCGWQAVTGQPWLVAVAAGGAAAIAAVIVLGLRAERRAGLADRFTEAVCRTLGSAQPKRSMVRVSHWKGWPTGHPRRMSLRYDAAIDPDDPSFRAEVTSRAERIFGSAYKVEDVRWVRGRIHLKAVRAREVAAVEEVPEIVRRAEAIVEKAFTQGATSKVEQDEHGDIARVEVKYTVDKRFARQFNRHDVDSTVTSFLKGRWRSTWDLVKDIVVYERRRPFPEKIAHPPVKVLPGSAIANYDKVRIPYGRDEDGNILYWYPAINPHFLVVGTSGSGKTVLMHGIVVEFCAQHWPVWVVDGKSTEFIGFRRWPNVQLVGTSIAEQVRIIHLFHELMEDRIDQITREEAQEDDFGPQLMVIDEFKAFKLNLIRLYKKVKVKGDPTEPEALGLVSDIGSRGRSIRFHLLIGTQRPDAAFLTGDFRDNIAARASMGKLSRDGAHMMWGSTRVGTSLPKQARGRGITSDDDGDFIEFQAYWTPDPRKATLERKPEDHELLETLRPEEAVHPRLHIVDPGETADIDDDGTPVVTYGDWASARIVPWTPDHDTAAKRHPAPHVPAGAADETDEDDGGSSAEEWDLEYGETTECPVEDLEPGDLVCLDEDSGIWASVESAAEDPDDDSAVCVDWRTDDDECGTDVFSADTVLKIRKLIDNAEEAA